jgi:hypothetical protein
MVEAEARCILANNLESTCFDCSSKVQSLILRLAAHQGALIQDAFECVAVMQEAYFPGLPPMQSSKSDEPLRFQEVVLGLVWVAADCRQLHYRQQCD